MNSKTLTIGIIAISALMLAAVSGSVSEQSFAKSVSECTNHGGHNSEGSCSGSDNNKKCEETHAGNSFNSKVKSSDSDC
ncbi:hypothetical protein [Candidatus Nitrosocosmicus sp. R]